MYNVNVKRKTYFLLCANNIKSTHKFLEGVDYYDDVTNKDEKEEGKYVRKERFVGECSRSFYVGEDIKQEDIKASFRNGTLKIEIPKKDEPKELPEKKYIPIDD